MRPSPSVGGAEDIQEEWSALRRALDEREETLRAAQPKAVGPSAPAPEASPGNLLDWALRTFRARAMPPPASPGEPANPLLERCLPQNVQRLDDACKLEGVFQDPRDYGLLVIGASRVLESELDHHLSRPARRLGGELLEAFGVRASPKQREAMAAWLEGRLPTTIGTVELVLHGLAEGLGRRIPAVASFVSSQFEREYGPLLEEGGLIRAAERIRNGFRNPAAHGTRRFGSVDYVAFSNLILGTGSVRDWIRLSSRPGPFAPDAALLHHHLELSRLVPSPEPAGAEGGPEGQGWRALLDLARLAPSSLEVACRVEGRSGWLSRWREPSAPSGICRLRIGDPLRIVLRVNRMAEVYLLDRTSDGKTVVLLPNTFRRTSTFPAGKELSLPDPDRPEPELCVLGPPGRDTLVAIATDAPLQGRWLPESAGERFRSVSDSEVSCIAWELSGLPRDRWGVACCTLDVLA